jgi:L-ribulose-5-phosphate 3-epimerase
MAERGGPDGIVLSGLADEAGDDIDTQIRAHRELGWRAIELRQIDGRMATEALGDAEFDRALARIQEAGLAVTGFASAIGNWSRPIDGDFALDVRELRSAARRMRQAGSRHIRTMSWLRGAATEPAWREEAIRRYGELVRIAEGEGIVLLHENCAGWGGQSGARMCDLIQSLGSPAVGILFDIGNTISHGYEPWEFYQAVKGRIDYVHVKDCRRNPAGGRSADYALVGEGHAMVREILGDLLDSGYRGVISIEPHIAAVIHHGGANTDPARRYGAYLDYARRTEEIVATAGARRQRAPA